MPTKEEKEFKDIEKKLAEMGTRVDATSAVLNRAITIENLQSKSLSEAEIALQRMKEVQATIELQS